MADSSFLDMQGRLGLSPCEAKLYEYYRQGEVAEITRSTAEKCGFSRTTVTNARRRLERMGLIECEQGRYGVYTVRTLDNNTARVK